VGNQSGHTGEAIGQGVFAPAREAGSDA